MAELTIRFSGGKNLQQVAWEIERLGDLTEAQHLFAINRQKERILLRTSQGRDMNGSPFHPYSTKGPYYYYPSKVGRHSKQSAFGFRIKLEHTAAKASASRFIKKVGSGTRTSGGGVKFASYAAFKASLGRSTVDLFGARAPHMLQAIVATAQRNGAMLSIGGPEADRASGLHYGVPSRKLKPRAFFGIGRIEEDLIVKDLEKFVQVKINQLDGPGGTR